MPQVPTWLKAISPLAAIIGSKKRGGKVRKTGNYKLHRGEEVVTAKRVKKKRGKSGRE